MSRASFFILLLLVGALLVACSPSVRSPQMQATVDAISTAAVATISQRMLGGPPSTPVPDGSAAASNASAPQPTLDLAAPSATAAAQAAAFEPFLAELPAYQLDPNRGEPAWLHPPLTLEAQGPDGANFANQFPTAVAANFLLAADIRWQAGAAQAGCGFLLRSDGDRDAPSQYLLGLSPLNGGRVYFSVVSQGESVSDQERDPSVADSSFSAADGAANRLAVVAQGDRFYVYTNGVLVAEFDPNQPPVRPVLPPPPPEPSDRSDPLVLSAYLAVKKQYDETTNLALASYNTRLRAFQAADRDFERGFVALGALAQSGTITCTFENAWLWHITG